MRLGLSVEHGTYCTTLAYTAPMHFSFTFRAKAQGTLIREQHLPANAVDGDTSMSTSSVSRCQLHEIAAALGVRSGCRYQNELSSPTEESKPLTSMDDVLFSVDLFISQPSRLLVLATSRILRMIRTGRIHRQARYVVSME